MNPCWRRKVRTRVGVQPSGNSKCITSMVSGLPPNCGLFLDSSFSRYSIAEYRLTVPRQSFLPVPLPRGGGGHPNYSSSFTSYDPGFAQLTIRFMACHR